MFKILKTGLKENKAAFTSFCFVGVSVVLAILVPAFWPYDYYTQNLDQTLLVPFSGNHIFGTDEFGRDLFVRVFEGIKISFIIGICAAVVQTVIGILYGGISGIWGGTMDEILMRIADILYSIPSLMIAMLLTLVMGSGELSIILAIALTDWTNMARIMRVQTFKLKDMGYVQASKVLGAGKIRILIRHILPNCLGPVLVNLMISIPAAIFAEAFLSFIGLGVKLPKASLGTLINDGYRYMTSEPWLMMIPLAYFCLIMLALNILGDTAREFLSKKG